MSAPASFAAPSAAGLDDETFIGILRDDMDDPPIPFAESFTTSPVSGMTFVRLSQFPVWDNDPNLSVLISNSLGQVNCHIVNQRKALQQGSNTKTPDVYIDYETGYLYFLDTPNLSLGGLAVYHSKVRWTNRRMLNALYAGLKAMFPTVWQRKSFTFQAQVNQYEYALSNDFLDPRTRIFRVEAQEIPFSTERYHTVGGAYPTQLNTLMVPWSQRLTPGANIRVSYVAPYYSLSDLEPQVQHLPMWYAKGKLLMDKEVLRVRYDLGSVAQNEQQYPPGVSQNAGIYHMQQFERELERLRRPIPHQSIRSVYSS